MDENEIVGLLRFEKDSKRVHATGEPVSGPLPDILGYFIVNGVDSAVRMSVGSVHLDQLEYPFLPEQPVVNPPFSAVI
jgi:hypothetical protein